jgi:Skp family chaperone for outer membrane proteins
MKFSFRYVVLGTLLALAAVGLGFQAGGGAGRPTVIVTVNLGAVIEKLDQRAKAEQDLKKIAEQLKAEEEKLSNELKKMRTDIEAMDKANGDDDSSEERKLKEDFLLKQMRYEAWKQFVIDKVDIEESLLLQDLYRSVKREAGLLASAAGYDLVLVDDSQGELAIDPEARMPRRAQVLQQIAGRRLLYTNKQIDITDDLVQRMNNAFKAVGPKPQN